MKKRVRNFILGLACALTCGLATAAVGCNTASDWLDQMKCEHVWNGGKVTVKATCTEEGKKVYECTKCGKEKKEELEKLPHTEHTVEMKAPTCDEKGMTDYVECSVCNAVIVAGKSIPALGHTEIELPGIEATCTTKGKTDGKYCTRCNEYTVEQTEIAALGHNLVTIEAVEATCKDQGLTAGVKCDRCDTIYSEPKPIPSIGHTIKNGVCTTCGTVTDATKFFEQTATMSEMQIDENHVATSGFYRVYVNQNVEEGKMFDDLNFGIEIAPLFGYSIVGGIAIRLYGEKIVIDSFGLQYVDENSNGGSLTLTQSDFFVLKDEVKEKGYFTIYFTSNLWTVKTDDDFYIQLKPSMGRETTLNAVERITKLY